MAIKKYSKSSSFYVDLKNDFFINNLSNRNSVEEINSKYCEQPIRLNCKLCEGKLDSMAHFSSHGVGYVFCSFCGHLNGRHQETLDFINALYVNNSGLNYSKNYLDLNFEKRTKQIYLPKVDFLIESIETLNFSVLDIGCGAGHFIDALNIKNIEANGIDVSKSMVDYGNQYFKNKFKGSPLTCVEESEFYGKILSSKSDVISAIGVIEHLASPRKFFEAFKKSKSNYLFISVPMYSMSVILESIFDDVYPRQLGGGHTHLFTERSIDWLLDYYSFTRKSEWRFGTDAMDLFRSLKVMVNLKGNDCLSDEIDRKLIDMIDPIQSIFDSKHFCSEIHCLIKK